MTKEEYIIWQIEQDDKLRNLINTSYITAQMDNIKQMRSLIIHFIAISAAIVGFTIPVLGRTELVKTQVFLIGGLFELLIVIAYGFWYLSWMLQKENRELTLQHKKFSEYLDKPREARNKFLANMTDENLQAWQDQQKEIMNDLGNVPPRVQKPDHALDIIFGAFFIALVLIILSLVDFSSLELLINKW